MLGMSSSNVFKVDVEGEVDAEAARSPTAEDELPTNVTTKEQLALVPPEYLSGDDARPLLSEDEAGNTYKHALKPMLYSVCFILVVEGLERLSYYGVSYTQTAYLQGKYDASWNANLTGVEASSWVSTSTAIAYSVPFLGAILADAFIGNYWTILLGALAFYLPGLLLIALTAYPYLLGPTFNTLAVQMGLLFLYPVGAGLIKASVSVFGAQQFHPLLQSVEKYYVRFYMVINIGALIGGVSIPIICQTNTFAAYMIPVVGIALAALIFLLGTPRYVCMKPQGRAILTSLRACGSSVARCPPSIEATKSSRGGKYPDLFVDSVKLLLAVVPTTFLVVPFNIAYSQMATTFVVQGGVMQNAGFVDASWMQNFDAFSVLLFGFLVSQFLYPALERRNITLHIATKYAIGTGMACLALLSAIIIDYQIHSAWNERQEKISVLWQAFPFLFIGCGEIFAISTSYHAAFEIAPPDQKALASAINLFAVGAVPNFISAALLRACTPMAFTTASGSTDISKIENYTSAKVYLYFWVLFGIAAGGVLINLLPPVRQFLTRVVERAKKVTQAVNDLGAGNGKSIGINKVDKVISDEPADAAY